MTLEKPVAVFDAGIGSYALVECLRRYDKKCDILYFADRAHFPYGTKTADELVIIMRQSFKLFERYDASAIIIASNAPSIMVFDQVKSYATVPIFGVYPPLKQALAKSLSGKVAILGVASMVQSAMARDFVKKHTAHPENVALINASSLVELVESAAFLFDRQKTRDHVANFMARLDSKIDVLTLSSTHLPWLLDYFQDVAPDKIFLDPADDIARALPKASVGNGQILGLVSEREGCDAAAFQKMLGKLNINIPLEVVQL